MTEEDTFIRIERFDPATNLLWLRVAPPTVLAEVCLLLQQVPYDVPVGTGGSVLMEYEYRVLTVAEAA